MDWTESNVGHVHVRLDGGTCKVDWGDVHASGLAAKGQVLHHFQGIVQGVVECDDVRENLFLTGEDIAVDQGFSQIEKGAAVST